MIEQIKTEEPPRPRSVDGRIPRDLETIVLKAIEKDPKRGTSRPTRSARTCGGSWPASRSGPARSGPRSDTGGGPGATRGSRCSAACLTGVLVLATVSSLAAMQRYRTLAIARGRTKGSGSGTGGGSRGPHEGRRGQRQPLGHPGRAAPDRVRHTVQPRPGRLGQQRRRPPSKSLGSVAALAG